MARTPGYDKYGRRKGKWTPEEDRKLSHFLTKYGYTNWRILPKLAGLSRCGKSCRLRWLNYLRPDVKRGNYSKDEEEIIVRLHGLLGNKWSAIAACLPGRTDNEVKNHWHTYLKKRLLPGQSPSSVTTTSHAGTNSDLLSEQAIVSERSGEPVMIHLDRLSSSSPATLPVTGLEPDIPPLPAASSPVTMTYSSSEPISPFDIETGPTRVPASSWELGTSTGEMHIVSPGRFWTEPFMSETSLDTSIPGCYSELSLYEEQWSSMFEPPALYSFW